jgi:hypothetical protein
MFLNKKINIPYPSNVGGGGLAPGLEATGLTFYDINALQVKVSWYIFIDICRYTYIYIHIYM